MSQEDQTNLIKDLLFEREQLKREIRRVEEDVKKRAGTLRAIGERLSMYPEAVSVEGSYVYLLRRSLDDRSDVPVFPLDHLDGRKLAGLTEQLRDLLKRLANIEGRL